MPNQTPAVEEESIYNLLPQPAPANNKPQLYHSKHPHYTPPTASTFGASTSTASFITNAGGDYENPARVHQHVKEFGLFGPKKAHQPNPAAFIPSHTHKQLQSPSKYTYSDRRKEPLNTRNTSAVNSQTSKAVTSKQKNFIKDNVVNASTVESKSSSNRDSPLIDYLNKPSYGETPPYLSTVKAQVEKEQQLIKDALQAEINAKNPPVQLLSDPDRIALLTQLKLRWEEVMQQYQVLTHQTTNTLSIGNQKRKEELEKKLAEIEKSINKIDKPFVVITQ